MIKWVLSVAICGELSADVHKLRTMGPSKVQEYHNEEAEARIQSDHKDRTIIQQTFALTIDPFNSESDRDGRILKIVTGQLTSLDVNC